MKKLLITTALLAGLHFFSATQASACNAGEQMVSTICQAPPVIKFKGGGSAKATLLPKACLPKEAVALMTGPGVTLWYTYYQRWNKGAADMPPEMRVPCITEQWVVPGAILGFWVDCHDPKDGKLYRWWWETTPIKTNGTYEMKLVKKVLF